MKNIPTLLFFTLLSSWCFGQIPNSGMENWDNSPRLMGWENNSYPLTLPPYDPYVIRQDTASHSGLYAAKFWANGLFKAYAKTTFPIVSHPQSLSLWYRTSFPPCVNDNGYPEKDTVSVLVEILSGNTVVNSGYWESITSNFSYSFLTIPISQTPTPFDSCRITILGGKVYGGCGFVAASTEFWVDELSLQYSSCIDSALINPSAVCPLIFLPVCGCDGVTYGNACEAENFGGVTNWTMGACNTAPGGGCKADFSVAKSGNAVQFSDLSSAASITNYLWVFGDDSSSTLTNPNHVYPHKGWYSACLYISGVDSANQVCTDSFCDSIYIGDGCIDSSLICPPGSLCCDAPLFMPVCGCDGVTYMNACVASSFGGVMSYVDGDCDSIPNGVEKDFLFDGFKIHPNPVANFVSLSFVLGRDGVIEFSVKNLLGQEKTLVNRTSVVAGRQQMVVNVSELTVGLYFIEMRIDGKVRVIQKILKE